LLVSRLSATRLVRPAVEQPEDPHSGSSQALAGLRWSSRVLGAIPLGARVP